MNGDDRFYVGYRELFEKPDRKGYTTVKTKAGVFTLEEAKSMTKFACSEGKARWYIACSALDSFDGEKLIPSEVY